MPRKSPVSDEVWLKIQSEYQAGKGLVTCKALAAKYGCKPDTVSARCKREGWSFDHRRKQRSGCDLASKVVQAVVQRQAIGLQKEVQSITDDATRFVAQQLRTSFMLAGKLEKRFEGEADTLKPKDLQSLTGAWRNTVDMGRQALRLDEQRSDTGLHFHVHGSIKPADEPPVLEAEAIPASPDPIL